MTSCQATHGWNIGSTSLTIHGIHLEYGYYWDATALTKVATALTKVALTALTKVATARLVRVLCSRLLSQCRVYH